MIKSHGWLIQIGYDNPLNNQGEIIMTANMGGLDRLVRFVIGAALLTSLFVGPLQPASLTSLQGIGMGVVGVIFVLTSLISFCPMYTLLGLKTKS